MWARMWASLYDEGYGGAGSTQTIIFSIVKSTCQDRGALGGREPNRGLAAGPGGGILTWPHGQAGGSGPAGVAGGGAWCGDGAKKSGVEYMSMRAVVHGICRSGRL